MMGFKCQTFLVDGSGSGRRDGHVENTCGGETKAREIGSNFLTCVGGVKCVVVGCVGLRKMMRRRFVAWCEHFGSASARARPKRVDTTPAWGARARARTQTSDEDRPKRAALTLDRTQDQAVLKEQRNPVFIRT